MHLGLETMWSGDSKSLNVSNHCIYLTSQGVRLFFFTVYRAASSQRWFSLAEISQLLVEKVIESVNYKRAVSILFAPSTDRSFCFCVDYCKLNATVTRHTYRLPRKNGSTDRLENPILLSGVPATCGYRQIKIDEHDRDKAEFTSHHGLHRFKIMFFELEKGRGPFGERRSLLLTL